ncbi:hypothetical protein LJB99_05040 [Deltaproteobacteria bacterium OttesenSCG-928-K17]|nr:hypothetical protein [Deltaproteobacteria bacterium OttesenSCG-928-K17]
MRKMTEEEIERVVASCRWATICVATEGDYPYAIEATPFTIGGDTCFMINPRGGVRKGLRQTGGVLLKYTLASPDLEDWIGVSCFGRGRFIDEPEQVREAWAALGRALRQEAAYSKVADRYDSDGRASPLFAVTVENRTGRCSAKAGERLPIL